MSHQPRAKRKRRITYVSEKIFSAKVTVLLKILKKIVISNIYIYIYIYIYLNHRNLGWNMSLNRQIRPIRPILNCRVRKENHLMTLKVILLR